MSLKRRLQKAEEASICGGYDKENCIQAMMKHMTGEDEGEAWAIVKSAVSSMPPYGLFEIYVKAKDRLQRKAESRGEKFISRFERDDSEDGKIIIKTESK